MFCARGGGACAAWRHRIVVAFGALSHPEQRPGANQNPPPRTSFRALAHMFMMPPYRRYSWECATMHTGGLGTGQSCGEGSALQRSLLRRSVVTSPQRHRRPILGRWCKCLGCQVVDGTAGVALSCTLSILGGCSKAPQRPRRLLLSCSESNSGGNESTPGWFFGIHHCSVVSYSRA